MWFSRVSVGACSEALEKAVVEIFLCEAWLKLLDAPSEHKEFIVCLARGFVELQRSQQELLDFLQRTEVSAVSHAWGQVTRFCKACLVIFAEPVEGVQSSDLFWFSEYKGPSLFERTMKSIVTQNSWWVAQLADVARTASTKPLAESANAKLKIQIRDPDVPWTTLDLKEVIMLFEEVRRSLREVELESYSEAILRKVKTTAAKFQATTELSTVAADGVDSILKLLSMFGHLPGAPSIQEEFGRWASGAQTVLRRNRFLQLLKSATSTDVKFDEVKQMLEDCPAGTFVNAKANPALIAGVLRFLDKGCQAVAHKAPCCWVVVFTKHFIGP